MPVCHEHRFIFIHIPKCAGTSVTHGLAEAGAHMQFVATSLKDVDFGEPMLPQHMAARKLRPIVSERVWNTYFKFAFVRNPWDRLVSFYHFHKDRVRSPEFRARRPRIAEIFAHTNSFEEWVQAGIYAPRFSFHLCDEKGGQLVDFIGRYETLQADFEQVCAHIGLRARLPHLRQTHHDDYRTYYTVASEQLVANHFRADIQRFGYRFA